MQTTTDRSAAAIRAGRLLAGVPPRGAEIIGAVSRDGLRTGALIKLVNGREVECAAGVLRNIPPERGPGRPEIGPATRVRLPEEMTARLDEIAGQRGVSRAAVIRSIIDEHLSCRPFAIRVADAFDAGSGTMRSSEGICESLDEARKMMQQALDAAPSIIAEMEAEGQQAISEADYWAAIFRVPIIDGEPSDDIEDWEQIEVAKLI